MAASTRGMAWIAGTSFRMGSEDLYPEERPVREVGVEEFWIDEHPVTVADFERFVQDTGYVTVAERKPDAAEHPGVDPELLVPGSLVFRQPRQPVALVDPRAWWQYVPGASWSHPEGPGSTVAGRDRHPVTHVAHEDCKTYASWAGKSLPTEAEWELAARGGLDGAVFAWGDECAPVGRMLANFWQGEFPWQNLALDGYRGTSPVTAFPPNGYGLHDMTGNVWEWTDDAFATPSRTTPCCGPGVEDVATGTVEIPRKVVKGGSHLCAANYCLRYRPAARQGQAVDSSACHIGFRCVVRSETAAKTMRPGEAP